MKITCKQQDLSRGLSAVSHAISNRSTLPILANILLATDHGRLKLAATNLEMGITCWLEAEIEEEGTTTIPAKLFTDFVSSLPQANVELSTPQSPHTLHVQGLRSSANIKGLDPTEFPQIPSNEGGELPICLEVTQLKEIISQVAFAASSDDDGRPVLTGVMVQISGEQATFAAADAFRLAVRVDAVSGSSYAGGDILIPARTLLELGRILPTEGSVEMIVTPNRSQVLFHTSSLDLVSRLIEGTFPNFHQIIPKESTTRAVVETKEFAGAVKSVALFARESSNIARVKVNAPSEDGQEPGTITIEATTEDLGDNVSTINATVNGPELQIIFNVKYLADVLAAIDTSEVAFEASSAMKPGVLKPIGPHNQTYVIMPMHVNR